MEPSLRDRARVFLADYTAVIVVLLVVCIGAGGWAVYAAQPETKTETVVTDRWDEQGEFNHTAEVTGATPVFERGTTLERQLYYTAVSPVLEGSYSYDHSDDSPRTVTLSLRVVIQSTREEGRLWRRTESVQTVEETVGPDEELAASWKTNVSADEARIERIQEQLGATLGTPEILVIAEVVTRAEDGQPTRHTRNLRVEPNGETFSVESPEPYSQETEITEQRTVETSVALPLAFGGTAVIVVGITGLGLLGAMRVWGSMSVSERERRRLRYASKRDELEEWITTGTTPTGTDDTPEVEVDDIEGLVDVAIDTNQRVIEDSRTGVLSVRTPTAIYRYLPPKTAVKNDRLQHGTIGDSGNGHTPTEEVLTTAEADGDPTATDGDAEPTDQPSDDS